MSYKLSNQARCKIQFHVFPLIATGATPSHLDHVNSFKRSLLSNFYYYYFLRVLEGDKNFVQSLVSGKVMDFSPCYHVQISSEPIHVFLCIQTSAGIDPTFGGSLPWGKASGTLPPFTKVKNVIMFRGTCLLSSTSYWCGA
jgi:hypothetical protein